MRNTTAAFHVKFATMSWIPNRLGLRRTLGTLIVTLSLCLEPIILQADSCPTHAKNRVFSVNDSGESLEGPLCVSVTYNPLRYSAVLGRTVTFSAGPNLQTGFAPPQKAGGELLGDDDLQAVKNKLKVQQNLFLARDVLNHAALEKVVVANSALRALVSGSDDLYRTAGSGGVIAATHNANLLAEVAAGASATWQPSDDINESVRALQNRAAQLLLFATTDAERADIKTVQGQLSDLLTNASGSLLTGNDTVTFYKDLAITRFWQNQINTLTPPSFTLSTYVDCPNVFNQNRSVAVSLIEADLMPTFDGNPTSATTAKTPFVTVTCASPFAVSAGVEMDFLKTPTFGFVPSGGTGTNTFGITDKGNVSPLPIGLVHWRLAEDSTHTIALYGSFGAAAHIQGNASGSSAAEYLTGLTVAFRRTVFFTPGWHLGKVASLAGGYTVGQTVPSGVTTVPVQSSYQSGFGLAISFSKP